MKYFISILICIFILHPIAGVSAEMKEQKVMIQVAGLYCPFCSYGLEKHVKKIPGFKSVQINIKKGTARIHFHPEAKVTEKAIFQAVEDAGFELDSVEWLDKELKNE